MHLLFLTLQWCVHLVACADKAMPGGGSKTLNMTGYQWWSEATHGVSHYYGAPEETHGKDTTTEYMTNFPFPITTAMSFNRSLWHATGAQIGREARAAMNVGNAYSTFWTPVVNMARGEFPPVATSVELLIQLLPLHPDPRWGRNLEAVGEDPTVTSEYAEVFVKGVYRPFSCPLPSLLLPRLVWFESLRYAGEPGRAPFLAGGCMLQALRWQLSRGRD